MVKVKSIEECVLNYIISVVPGAIKTKWYWMKQGYNEDHAIGNAMKYGIGQLSAGVGDSYDRETCARILREMADICNAFAELLYPR